MDYGISFFITTKGDPSFLLELPGFIEYKPRFVAMTIEGPPEVLALLSPRAPSYDARIATAAKLSSLGVDIVVRLDPIIIHLFQAVYDDSWFERIDAVVEVFAGVGAKHVIASTGRLSKRRSSLDGREGTSAWQRIHEVIHSHSPLAAKSFKEEYIYEAHWSGGGYRLRRDLRTGFHRRVKELVEARGMTYATCQELAAEESDSQNIPHCEGLPLPFVRRQAGGGFEPIRGCTANCHVSCRGLSTPPCGQSELISCQPLRIRKLSCEAPIRGI